MRQALELALEALEGMQNAIYNIGGEHVIDLNYAVEKADVAEQAITAIKEALAQPEQEPVAFLTNHRQRLNIELKPQTFVEIPTVTDWEMPLYMKPQQRTWVGLTDEEILDVNMSTVTKVIDEPIVCDTDHNIIQLGKAIEAKLKEKNT